MKAVSWPGYLPQALIIVLLAAFWLYCSGLSIYIPALLLGVSISSALVYITKMVVQQPRPTNIPGYSFPSGHATFYVVLFGFLAYIIHQNTKNSILRNGVIAALLVLIVLGGISRVYLGMHWPHDVIAGYVLGCVVLYGMIYGML